jgi:hypothetical protein
MYHSRYLRTKYFSMKALLLLCLFAMLAVSATAQTVNVRIGSDKYVTINGQNYPRGYLLSQYNYAGADSTLALLYANTRTLFIKPTNNASYRYGDSTDAPANSMLVLRAWMNANFENK